MSSPNYTEHFACAAEGFLAQPVASSEDEKQNDEEAALSLSYDELKGFLTKFKTNGEEIFKVRHLLALHLESLLGERDSQTDREDVVG